MSHKILVVDDDARLRALVTRYLSEQGFSPFSVSDGEKMHQLIQRTNYHLYILDVNLPNENGFLICQRLRALGDKTPIIMLTSRVEEIDLITGLELGADDYLAKPFNPRELLARIRSVLRRCSDRLNTDHQTEDFQYEFGNFSLNAKTQQLSRNGEPIPLTHNEFVLLKIVIQNQGQPISRAQLSARIYARDQDSQQRDIDMLISRLRKRLKNIDDHGNSPEYIETIRGIGYRFVSHPSRNS